MMRSLWTGASGMTAQQLNIDVISNNISNVNTTGYKRERAEFQTLLYQTMEKPVEAVDTGLSTPAPMQVGHGVKTAAISRDYQVGSFQRTENTFDFALNGTGFFAIQKDDDVYYTRDGSFKTSVMPDDAENLYLVTTDGYPVLDTEGEPIVFPADSTITVDQMGNFYTTGENGDEELGIQFQLVQFANANGLSSEGGNLYKDTIASGEPIAEAEEEVANRTTVQQGAIEMSNVQVADEMVKLIVAQRAYELNSKSITTSDEMLQTANQLKR